MKLSANKKREESCSKRFQLHKTNRDFLKKIQHKKDKEFQGKDKGTKSEITHTQDFQVQKWQFKQDSKNTSERE